MKERPMKAKLSAAAVYCIAHRKQLSAAFALGMGLVEAIQRAH